MDGGGGGQGRVADSKRKQEFGRFVDAALLLGPSVGNYVHPRGNFVNKYNTDLENGPFLE